MATSNNNHHPKFWRWSLPITCIGMTARGSSSSWERASMGAAAFSFNCPSLAVYASMIDGRGETPMRLRMIDVDEAREPVLEFETAVNFLDPTEEVEMVFRLVDLVFPEPGDYRLQMYGADQFLRERRFLV